MYNAWQKLDCPMRAVSYLDNGDLSSKEKKIKILLILIVFWENSYLENGDLGFKEKGCDLASRERSASIETALSPFWVSCHYCRNHHSSEMSYLDLCEGAAAGQEEEKEKGSIFLPAHNLIPRYSPSWWTLTNLHFYPKLCMVLASGPHPAKCHPSLQLAGQDPATPFLHQATWFPLMDYMDSSIDPKKPNFDIF